MLIDAPRHVVDAILGAMEAVALVHGEAGVTPKDRRTIAAAGRIVFGFDEQAAMKPLPVRSPAELAGVLTDPEQARIACRVLSIMTAVDMTLDQDKVDLVREYATALSVHEDYLEILRASVRDEMGSAAACMIRKNLLSFPHLDHEVADALDAFLPYRNGKDDPELTARYTALGELPEDTFGWAFWDHFMRNGFAFPGAPDGLGEGFTTPHDSSHVMAGYSTSQAGEICVSTFIGAMHPDHPMAAEILPVLFSWHMDIKLNEIAGSFRGAFEPNRFWTAWDRGHGMRADLLAADWDFWVATEVPLDELRNEYGLAPAAAELRP
ncbi:MAG: hypothetical protein ACR2N6_02145 [Miltoncostaeaceae bacterium]